MAGFRRSTWFALGLMMGGLMGGALGLILAPPSPPRRCGGGFVLA